MTSFNPHFFIPAAVGVGLVATACFGGNQELVGRKTAELRAINEQVVKQAVPGGLKEGETVEVKATLRVERSPEKGPVVRDVQIESVKVSPEPVAAAAGTMPPPVAGSGKIREPDAAEKQPAEGNPGFRQERLNVPATTSIPEIKVPPVEEEKTIQPPTVAAEKPPVEGTPGFRQERLSVPSVNEKRKE